MRFDSGLPLSQGSVKCKARVITRTSSGHEKVIYKSFEHNHPQKPADTSLNITKEENDSKIF